MEGLANDLASHPFELTHVLEEFRAFVGLFPVHGIRHLRWGPRLLVRIGVDLEGGGDTGASKKSEADGSAKSGTARGVVASTDYSAIGLGLRVEALGDKPDPQEHLVRDDRQRERRRER